MNFEKALKNCTYFNINKIENKKYKVIKLWPFSIFHIGDIVDQKQYNIQFSEWPDYFEEVKEYFGMSIDGHEVYKGDEVYILNESNTVMYTKNLVKYSPTNLLVFKEESNAIKWMEEQGRFFSISDLKFIFISLSSSPFLVTSPTKYSDNFWNKLKEVANGRIKKQ